MTRIRLALAPVMSALVGAWWWRGVAAADRVETLFHTDAPHVQELDAAGFEKAKSSGKPWAVNFYAPWCGHCIHFAPSWREVGKAMAGSEVHIGAVSCVKEHEICRAQNVQSYPSLRAFGFPDVDSGTVINAHTTVAVVSWLESHVAPERHGLRGAGKAGSGAGGGGDSTSSGGDGGGKKDGEQQKGGEGEKGEEVSDADMDDYAHVSRGQRLEDALTSIRFALNKEVFRGTTRLSGEPLERLRDVLNVLSLSFPGTTARRAFVSLLAEIENEKTLDVTEWDRLLSRVKDLPLSSSKYTWGTCRPRHGQFAMQGYTCGLWSLFHILTVNSGSHGTSPGVVMEAVNGFVREFFGCEYCKGHFVRSYDGCEFGRCGVSESAMDSTELVLWLWRFHNAVNIRVARERAEKEGQAFGWTNATAHMWPTPTMCTTCWNYSPESFTADAHTESDAIITEKSVSEFLDKYANQLNVHRHILSAYVIPDTLADALLAKHVGSVAMSIGPFGVALRVLLVLCVAMMVWYGWRGSGRRRLRSNTLGSRKKDLHLPK